jgi:hypothetical protein
MSAEADAGRAVIPDGVGEAIEHQRLQLMRASTALSCLWITSLYQEWHDVEIDAGDVALLVRRVIDEAVLALDSVVLAQAASEPEPDESDEPEDDDDDGDDDDDD